MLFLIHGSLLGILPFVRLIARGEINVTRSEGAFCRTLTLYKGQDIVL